MSSTEKMWLCVSLWCVFSLVNADENITESWNSTTVASTPLHIVNLTSEWLNSTTVPSTTLDPLYNETDASNFIATDYTNANSTYLEHFTKFNWTVLDTFDNSFGGTDDIGVKQDTVENANTNSSRAGYERNLMVVLPVMQGNSELSNSNLQILYTQPPVTAIIGGEPNEERGQEMPHARTTIKMLENRVEYSTSRYNNLERIDQEAEMVADQQQDSKRHPYMEFLLDKPASKSKSPLDYGYPETFKFIEDFNELPKNHRPDWAVPDVGSTPGTKKSTADSFTKRDPFQMFESVKPLEINKLLSFKPIPVTDSLTDDTVTYKKKHQFLDLSTELPLRLVSKRPYKRPNKKPQKNKSTVLPKFATINIADLTTQSTISSPSIEEMYTAAKYTNLPSQTTAAFLPTPWREPANERTVKTTTPTVMPTEPPTTLSMAAETTKEIPTTTTTTTPTPTTTISTTISTTTETTTSSTTESTTRLSSTTQAIPNSTFFSTTECSTDHKKHQIKPSDLINLKKILDNEFGNSAKSTTESTKLKETTNSPLSEDILTSDMRNMLIALGLLRSDGRMREQPTTTTTTTSNYLQEMFMKRQPATPNIDPHSYVSFKKIPIDFGRQSERMPVSDEMKDLLASFGLLPRSSYGVSLTRMARQHKAINADTSSANSTSGNAAEPIESLDVLTPQPFNYQPHENGHVFHPTVHLETLGDEKKLEKINQVIDTIKRLSKKDNATIEEIEEQLENITSVINDENISNDPFLAEVTNMITKTKAKIKSFEKNDTSVDLKTNSDFNYKPDESSVVLNTYSGRDKDTDLKLANGPSPLSSEELQQLLEANKNDVKRQQPSNSTSEPSNGTGGPSNSTSEPSNSTSGPSNSTSEPSNSTSEPSNTTSEPSNTTSGNAPLPELAASFGGGETASEEPAPEALPTAKPNGLYFFVDWNTFLNVGESDKNPVRVRFSPRAGNPRNFLPITLP